MSAYKEWIAMYTPELENIEGDNPLRRLLILLHVYDHQVAEIRNKLQNEFKSLEKPSMQPNGKDKVDRSMDSTIFLKPLHYNNNKKQLKTNGPRKSLSTNITHKESPDMFAHSPESNLNTNIDFLSEDETVLSSPEKSSPRIKKKRHLQRNKGILNISNNNMHTPTNDTVLIDDLIEATPQEYNMRKNIQTTIKKKLFPVINKKKSSQSLINMSKLIKNRSQKSHCNVKKNVNASTQVSQRKVILQDDCDQESDNDLSMMHIDDILINVNKSAENDKEQSNLTERTEKCNTPKEDRKALPKCFRCDGLGSPCIQHRLPLSLREPEQTFSGFWNLDFTDPKTD